MPNEEKKGKYEQFDVHEASWVCPNCKKDALKVEDHYRYHGKLKTFYTFFCVNCQLDSNYYGVYVKEKESFNAVYRQFSKELEWARWLLQKGRDEGVIACNKRHAEIFSEQMQHRKCFRKIWSDVNERDKRLQELRAIAGMYPEYIWRIYETVNWRDLRKTWYAWNQKMLDWQRSDPNGKMEWLDKVHSEWTSTMMRPECRHKDELLFLIDKDDKNELSELELFMSAFDIKIKEKYETPRGWHYLVEPFNKGAVDFKDFNAEIHTDGLRLVEVL